MRRFIFEKYCQFYQVIKEDILLDISQFKNFEQFFTRKIKYRKMQPDSLGFVSPVDGKVLKISKTNQDKQVIIKNREYSIKELLNTNQEIQELKKHQENELVNIVIYLAPGDYHRFHSPISFHLKEVQHIPGLLRQVNKSSLLNTNNLYPKNERIIFKGETQYGNFFMTAVGALNVGNIKVDLIKDLQTNSLSKKQLQSRKFLFENQQISIGEQLGLFQLGSTVTLLIEVPNGLQINEKKQIDKKIRFGDPLFSQ